MTMIYGGAGDDTLYSSPDGDWLFGLGGNDVLYGGDGYDKLDGGTGFDYMRGGLGNDYYTIDSIYDIVDEDIYGGGTGDQVTTSVSFASSTIEGVILTGTANINATLSGGLTTSFNGNSGDNVLTGGAGRDRMFAGGGADTLYGFAGDDSLDGGAGDDTLDGGAGSDAFYGGDGNDVLYGGDGFDQLNGGTGFDYMRGGLGNDVYWVDSIYDIVDEETYGGGTVDVVSSSVSFASASIETVLLTGAANINAVLTGGLRNQIFGNDGNNILVSGDAGLDILYGQLGNDYMLGGAGTDYFVFNYDVAAGQIDVIGDFAADYVGLPTYLRNNVYVIDTVYGVDIACYAGGSWYQILLTNTHNAAQVTAGIYYYDYAI